MSLPREFQDLADLTFLAPAFSPECTDLELTTPEYDLRDISFGIQSPVHVRSSCNSKLICRRLVILSSNVTISGIDLTGAIIGRSCSNLTIQNCHITQGDPGSGGAIILTECTSVTIDHVRIESISRSSGIFAERESSFTLTDSTITKLEAHPIISLSARSKAVIRRSTISEGGGLGLSVSVHCEFDMEDSEVSHTAGLFASLSQSAVRIVNCRFHHGSDAGVMLGECANVFVSKNSFRTLASSAITASGSTGDISENTFAEIEGNALYLSQGCRLTVSKNEVSGTVFPAIALLRGAVGTLIENSVSDTARSGICLRGAKSVTLVGNRLANCGECGISCSDTPEVVCQRNKFTDCQVAGIELYNQSHVKLEDNEFVNPGRFAVSVFTGAVVVAERNSVRNAAEAMASFRASGGGDLIGNAVEACPELVAGPLTAPFFFSGNGNFPNRTNVPERATEAVPFEQTVVDPNSGKCLRCENNPREVLCNPCGHRVFCRACAEAVLAEGPENGRCTLCRFPLTLFTDPTPYMADVCPVCREEKTEIAVVLPCGHSGCWTCLRTWFQKSATCPVCRHEQATPRRLLPDY
jgi:hypothetical protein